MNQSLKINAIKKKKRDIKNLIRKLGATDLLHKRVYSLSPSQRRLISIVSGIAADSKVLIIDDLDAHLTTEELKTVKGIHKTKVEYFFII